MANLNLIEFFLQMNGVPPVVFESSLELFRSARNPQKINSDEDQNSKGFWDSIYALIMEGRLLDAWKVLSLHGQLAGIIGSDEKAASSAGLEYDKRLLLSISDVMNTHPYIHLISAIDDNYIDNKALQLPQKIALDFKDWQQKVSNILESQSPLLGIVGELNTLLLLLLGDKYTLVVYAQGEWTSLATGLFLYVYPPPLIRANISKIVESAMTMVMPRENVTEAEKNRYFK
jgi:hypothetical protein